MKDWYQYRPWNLTHRIQVRESRHMSYHTVVELPNSCDPMEDGPFRYPKGRSYPHPKFWTHRIRIDINIGHRISPIDASYENQGTWHIIRRHYYQIAAAQWRPVPFGTKKGSALYTLQILDPSMKDWYQYRPWNLTHRTQLRESRHITYHTAVLLPNRCSQIADGSFLEPNGRSYPHPKYWTHQWRIDINIGHGILFIGACKENQGTWHIIRHYYGIAAAQWRVVHFGTARVGFIYTPDIGLIDEGLISISAMKSNPKNTVKRIKVHELSYGGTTTEQLRPNGGCPFCDPKGRAYTHPKYLTHRWRNDINIGHWISPILFG